MPDASPGSKASKSCHTCRRSRLRCDRNHPHCNKCFSRGVECLGYGKLFLWTGAVASRGKLAWHTTSAALCHFPNQQAYNLSSGFEAAFEIDPTANINHDWTPYIGADYLPRSLVDPLLQDMSVSDRRYLGYFSSRLCRDLVAVDTLERNPFRNLIPLTQAYPLLYNVIVAISAAHMYNEKRRYGPGTLEGVPAPGTNRLLMDALGAKQKALRMMPSALQSIHSIGADIMLAAVMFLVNIELLESGSCGWKPHMEGANEIVRFIQPFSAVDESLRDYIMSDYFIYYVLGLVTNPQTRWTVSSTQQQFLLSIFNKSLNHFSCCPPKILEVLISATQITTEGGIQSEQMKGMAGLALLERAQGIDIISWAHSGDSHQNPIPSRLNAGSAHRLAACLYILQAIPLTGLLVGQDFQDMLLDEMFQAMSSITDQDPNFKATAWPTFMFGATRKTVEAREWAADRLKRMTIVFPWGFLVTAVDTLQMLWRLEAEGKQSCNWVQTLRDLDVSFFII